MGERYTVRQLLMQKTMAMSSHIEYRSKGGRGSRGQRQEWIKFRNFCFDAENSVSREETFWGYSFGCCYFLFLSRLYILPLQIKFIMWWLWCYITVRLLTFIRTNSSSVSVFIDNIKFQKYHNKLLIYLNTLYTLQLPIEKDDKYEGGTFLKIFLEVWNVFARNIYLRPWRRSRGLNIWSTK